MLNITYSNRTQIAYSNSNVLIVYRFRMIVSNTNRKIQDEVMNIFNVA